MKLLPIILTTLLFSILLVSASIDDIKPTICNSINLTEPNCTTWWNTLNLTDANLTTITIIYNPNYTTINQTINNSYYDYYNVTNITYTGNYSIYNITNNITNFADGANISEYNSYSKSEIDGKIPDLSPYVLKSEVNSVVNDSIRNSNESYTIKTTNDIAGIWKFWVWVIGILTFILICAVGYLIFMGMNG